MSSSSASKVTFASLAIIGLLVFAVSSSYRLGLVDLSFVWQVNVQRYAPLLAAGLAFGLLGAMRSSFSKLGTHVLGFSLVATVSSLLLLGQLVFENWWAGLIGAGFFIAALLFSARKYYSSLDQGSVLILVSLVAFGLLLSIANYLGAAFVGGQIGSLIFWSQGYPFAFGSFGVWMLPACLVLMIVALRSSDKELPQLLLMGLGLGVVGPLFFIAYLAPLIASAVISNKDSRWLLLLSALLGALIVAFAHLIPSLLIGGYTPSLIIPIAALALPLIVWNSRQSSDTASKNILKGLAAMLWIVLVLSVVYQVAHYAAPLI